MSAASVRCRPRVHGIEFRLPLALLAPELLLRHRQLLPLCRPALGDLAFGFESARLARQPHFVAEPGLHVGEQLRGHDPHVLDLDRLDREAPLLGDVGEFLLELQDDRAAFAQHVFDRHLRDLVSDGGLDDILEIHRDRLHRLAHVGEVEILARLLGVADLPDREAAHFDPLVLGRDLVGGEGQTVGARWNAVVAVDHRQAEDADAAALVANLPESLMDQELSRVGDDVSEGFHLVARFRFHALAGRFRKASVSRFFDVSHEHRIAYLS